MHNIINNIFIDCQSSLSKHMLHIRQITLSSIEEEIFYQGQEEESYYPMGQINNISKDDLS